MKFPLKIALIACASVAAAQDQPNTVLVMDGSGSMWGQVDGVAKITIAQTVVGDLLSDFPSDQGLGLTVYGHRERGECTDIETIVAPAPGTAAQITDAVNKIKPLGKTPMTDAVIAAAQALRYTEEKATVILVSDGVETCNPDPCAAARLLEEAGIDFTAHVIGFDVGSDAEALAQMKCIAKETGGKFLTADTADQLTEALSQVAVASPEPEPEPALVPTTLTAVIEGTESLVAGPVLWELRNNTDVVLDDTQGNPLELNLEEGSYTVIAYSIASELEMQRQFVAIGAAATVEIGFPKPIETARVLAPVEAVAGSVIQVGWDGPNAKDDYIGIGAFDADGANMWQNWAYTASGNPVELLMPPQEGPHLIQYFKREGRESLGAVEIFVTPVTVTLAAPESAPAGSQIEVSWTGPDYSEDYIGIGMKGTDGANQWENWAYTRDGSPATLTVPETPGEYEITYFMRQGRTPVESVAFVATPVSASILAPTKAEAGSTIEIGWTGPDYPEDYIGIGRVDAKGAAQWDNWAYTRDGNPVKLLMPGDAGDYLITYFQRQDRTPLVSVPIKLTPLSASINAPSVAIAGDTIELTWTGPDYKEDYIGVGPAEASGANRWQNWVYTREGSPTELVMPPKPGDYLITYFQRQDRSPLFETSITLRAPEAGLTVPEEAIAGSQIDVVWSGPDYSEDYIGIGRVGASGASQWETWRYTRDGNPAQVTVPSSAGDYVVTYFMQQDRTKLVETPLKVTTPDAKLTVPNRAQAGSTIEIGWDGPNYEDDYIGIGLASASGAGQWKSWAYVREGNPLPIVVPEVPGEYRVRYFMRQDRTILAEAPLIVE